MTDDMEDLNQTYPGAGNFLFGETAKENEQRRTMPRSPTLPTIRSPNPSPAAPISR